MADGSYRLDGATKRNINVIETSSDYHMVRDDPRYGLLRPRLRWIRTLWNRHKLLK